MSKRYKQKNRIRTYDRNHAGDNTSQAVLTMDNFTNPMSRAGFGQPNVMEGTDYTRTQLSQNYMLLNTLYRSHWIVQRIINTVPADMTKNWYKIESPMSPDNISQLEKVTRQTQIRRKITEGLRWGRLYGGAAGVIVIDGQEDMLEEPLDYDTIMPGTFKGLIILDRWSGIAPGLELVDDVSDPEFGYPDTYNIITSSAVVSQQLTASIHHSRIVRFTGRELPNIERQLDTYWGASELEHIYEELKKRDNVSYNIALLTFMANIRTMKVEGMEQMLSTGSKKDMQDIYSFYTAMNWLMNNQGMQILGPNDDFQTHQYTFSGIAEAYEKFMLDVAGAADMPVTKLFGRAPAGMNATGESDMQNYYDGIALNQEDKVRPVIEKLLPIMCLSEFGAIPDELTFAFNPVRPPTEQELKTLAKDTTTVIIEAYNAGLVSQHTALKELRQSSEKTGMWTNITDEDIDNANKDTGGGEGMFPGLMGTPSSTMDADWDEGKHDRDKNGKFTSGGGGSASNKAESEENSAESLTELMGKEYKDVKGKAAIEKLIKERNGHVKGAFYRKDIGGIDLIWGNEDLGLAHIIARREKQNIETKEFLSDIADVVEKGTVRKVNDRGNFEILYNGKMAIVSPELKGNKLTFLLTAFKTRYK